MTIRPEDRVLDWERRFSPRSLAFTITDNFSLSTGPRNRNWTRYAWYDQGNQGACTGFGAAHILNTTPKRRVSSEEEARQIYYEARRRDEYAGENYEGSSVLGAMETLKAWNYSSAYYWATTLDEIVHAVSLYGPMEIGVNWYGSMFNTNTDGFVTVSGSIAGGHALSLAGVNITERWFRLDNSWGQDWGVNGSARISWDDLDRLRSEQGEFALPKKIKVVTSTPTMI